MPHRAADPLPHPMAGFRPDWAESPVPAPSQGVQRTSPLLHSAGGYEVCLPPYIPSVKGPGAADRPHARIVWPSPAALHLRAVPQSRHTLCRSAERQREKLKTLQITGPCPGRRNSRSAQGCEAQAAVFRLARTRLARGPPERQSTCGAMTSAAPWRKRSEAGGRLQPPLIPATSGERDIVRLCVSVGGLRHRRR